MVRCGNMADVLIEKRSERNKAMCVLTPRNVLVSCEDQPLLTEISVYHEYAVEMDHFSTGSSNVSLVLMYAGR